VFAAGEIILEAHVIFHTDFVVSEGSDFVVGEIVDEVTPLHSQRLETTSVKSLLITLKYKHIIEDAALGFFRSSLHGSVLCLLQRRQIA
jgi:hypothetical protein